jgi:hypothetical protein
LHSQVSAEVKAFHAEVALKRRLQTEDQHGQERVGGDARPAATEVRDVGVAATVQLEDSQCQTEVAPDENAAMLAKYLAVSEEREILRDETDKNVTLRLRRLDASLTILRQSTVKHPYKGKPRQVNKKNDFHPLQKLLCMGVAFIVLYLLTVLLISSAKAIFVKKQYVLKAW